MYLLTTHYEPPGSHFPIYVHNNLLKIRTLRQRKAHRGLTMTTGDKFTMSESNFFSPTAFFVGDIVTSFSNNVTPLVDFAKIIVIG